MRRIAIIALVGLLGFLAACFPPPLQRKPRYTFFPYQPEWYKLDTEGLK